MIKDVSFDDTVSWRLHWLMCDLWQLKRDIVRIGAPSRVSGLYNSPYSEALEKIKKVDVAYIRLRWEVQTMLSIDYAHEVDPYFDNLPKNTDYQTALREVKEIMQIIANDALRGEKQYLEESLKDIGSRTF